MVELNSIRAIIALATQHPIKLHQFNVFMVQLKIFKDWKTPQNMIFFANP
jgi:hypothetical protein